MIWGTALVLILGTLTTVETLAQVTATLAVDNAYIVCWGGATAITSCDPMPPSFHGAYAGGPQPNTHTIPATSSDYIYVVAWSDDLVAQGFLGEFSGNLGTVYSAMNSSSPWQVCPASPLVSEDRDIPDQPSNTIDAPTTPPSIAQLNTRLASCTWQSVAIGPTNGSPPWGMKAGISTSAQWIWFNSNQPACQGISAPFAPGCNHQEYLIFRIPASLIVIEEQVDLAVEKRIANIPWQVGDTGQFSILVSNNGPGAVSSGTTIIVTDSIPSGMNYTGFSGQGWNCTPSPTVPGPVAVTCTYTLTSSLSANQTLPLLTLTVQPTAPGGFENCVSVEAPVSDLNLNNNQKCREGEIIPGAGTEVCILKFEDLDGDGQKDPNEQGLGGWTFNVTPSNISPAPPITTYPDGLVCFKVIDLGTYTITEQVQPGWTLTTPNPQTVTVQAGQSITVAFGNKKQCVPTPPGLIEWWALDETSGNIISNLITHPISGHGPDLHNGIPRPGAIGSANGPVPISGMVGSALQFDGVDDFVEVLDGAGTLSHGNPTSNFTIDAWVKVNAEDASGVKPIVDKRFDFPDSQNPNIHTRGYAFYLFNGRLGFQIADDMVPAPAGLSQICDAGPPFTSNCTNYVSPGPNIADGQWHHVAVTVQRTGTPEVRLYVDGNLVLTKGARTGNANSSIRLLIGSGYPIVISQPFFKGAIDEVQIFNRALNEGEIQAIFQAGPVGKCKPQLPTPPQPPQPPQPPSVGFAVCAAGPDNIIDDLEMLSIIDAWIKQHSYQTCGVPTDVDVLQALDTWIKAGTRSEATAFVPLQVRMIALSQNPVRTSAAQFVIEGNGISQTSVRVFTLNGREVFSQTNHGNIVSFAKAGELPNGVYLYIVRVRGYDGREYVSEVRKLVILR